MSVRRRLFLSLCIAGIIALILHTGSEPQLTPPPSYWAGGLPIMGSRGDALKAGFTRCFQSTRNKLRCRREGVMVLGQGPYSAATDLRNSDGSGGFTELILWHQWDQHAMGAVSAELKARGWDLCRTAVSEFRGDQEIFTKPGSPVRFSIDLSYWGKRRLRILPERDQPKGKCW